MAGLVGGPDGGAPPLPDAGEFSKICKKFFKKIAKMKYFSIFCKKFQNPALNFRTFARRTQFLWEILRKFFLKCFDENSIEKIEFLSIFGKSCC